MVLKKYILVSVTIIVIVIALCGLYLLYLSPSERNAKVIRDKISLIEIAMKKSKVIELYSQPDAIYLYDSN